MQNVGYIARRLAGELECFFYLLADLLTKPSMKLSSARETAPRILLSGRLRAHAIYYSAHIEVGGGMKSRDNPW